MAREEPPIIISNGGVAEALADGLIAKDGNEPAYEIILDNVRKLNAKCGDDQKPEWTDRPVAKSLGTGASAKIYWRLASEDNEASDPVGMHGKHPRETGRDAQ